MKKMKDKMSYYMETAYANVQFRVDDMKMLGFKNLNMEMEDESLVIHFVDNEKKEYETMIKHIFKDFINEYGKDGFYIRYGNDKNQKIAIINYIDYLISIVNDFRKHINDDFEPEHNPDHREGWDFAVKEMEDRADRDYNEEMFYGGE